MSLMVPSVVVQMIRRNTRQAAANREFTIGGSVQGKKYYSGISNSETGSCYVKK